MKNYIVEIEFEIIEFRINAKNKADARKKALNKLKRKNPCSFIKKAFGSHRKEILIDEY